MRGTRSTGERDKRARPDFGIDFKETAHVRTAPPLPPEIENIVTTADHLFRHVEGAGRIDAATKEALRYRQALLEAFDSLSGRPLGTHTAEEICSLILGASTRVRSVPGTALANSATGEIVYSPPGSQDRLRDLLANWEHFVHGTDPRVAEIEPLVRMAVAHYQFEAIHPFTAGNGRTGRVLNSLFLVEQGLLPLPILYLSRYFIAHKESYYRLLLGVTQEAAWEPWILFVLRAVGETASWTRQKIATIREIAGETAERVRTALPKIYSRELVDLFSNSPTCASATSSTLVWPSAKQLRNT